MTVTAASFRTDFPEFASTTVYPDAAVNYWINFATLSLNVDRWGTLLDQGTELFVAHNLVLEAKAQAEATNGAPPGMATGMVNSKSVDKVSVGYDTGSASEEDGSHWNLTIYGIRYLRMARMMGAGGIFLGAPAADTNYSAASNAWPGPYWPWNG